MVSLSRATLIAALTGALALACLTPSVPIPPPEPETMSFSIDAANKTARYASPIELRPDPSYGGATVYVYNRDQGVGVITTANPDGSVSPTEPFAGDIGNDIIVTYELDSQLAATCVKLREGQSGPQYECPLSF